MVFANIVRDKNISFGQPTVKGRRLTVFDIIYGIKYDTFSEYINDHDLKINEVKEAILYCKELVCQNNEYGKFCNGCVLSSIKDGWKLNKHDLQEVKIGKEKVVISEDGNNIYLGNLSEYEEDTFGRMGWAIAEEVFEINRDILKGI